MNDQEYQDPRENLDKLIISLCTSGSTKLDDAQLKELKSICKYIFQDYLDFFK